MIILGLKLIVTLSQITIPPVIFITIISELKFLRSKALMKKNEDFSKINLKRDCLVLMNLMAACSQYHNHKIIAASV
jgi:hypothetical protein